MKDHDYKWIGALYKKGKRMIKRIINHRHGHYIFYHHSKLKLLKIVKTKFASYYHTFKCLLTEREALASMVSSESWQGLKDKATSTFDKTQISRGGRHRSWWQVLGTC
jgi:hypothetical protein